MPYPTKKLGEKNIFKIIGSGINYFDGKKFYYSTSSIKFNKLGSPESIITFDNRPSRANMQFDKGVVIFAKMKNTKKVIVIDKELSLKGIFSTGFSGIKGNTDLVEPKYLYYYFISDIFNKIKDNLSSGVTQVAINNNGLKNIPIPLPPLPTQKLIVAKLDELFANLDKQIELTKKQIENIEELNKSVLEEVFSKGEWEEVELEKVISKIETWNPKTIGNDEFYYIDISSIDNKNYKLTSPKVIKGIEAPSRAKQLVNKNDIIFATTRPNLKNIAIINLEFNNLTCSTGFCVLRANKDKIYYKYLFYFLITDIVQEKISVFIRGAQYPAISNKDLKQIKLPLPPLQTQKEVVSYLDQVFEKNNALKKEYETKLKNLEELKQSVLKEAFENEEFVK